MTSARLDRDRDEPLWAQLESDLRARLARGEFAERFPTDRELTQEYGVSRHTAREAVRRLHADGVLSRRRGRGSFVNPDALEQSLGALYSLFRSVEEQGLPQRSEVLAADVRRDATAASELGEDPDADLVFVARLRWAGDEPLAVDRVWLPAQARPLLEADLGRAALYEELSRRTGLTVVAGEERIQPTLPDPADAALLGVPASHPVFAVARRGRTRTRVIERRHTVIRGDRYAFVARWGEQGQQGDLRAAAAGPDPSGSGASPASP